MAGRKSNQLFAICRFQQQCRSVEIIPLLLIGAGADEQGLVVERIENVAGKATLAQSLRRPQDVAVFDDLMQHGD